MRYRNLGKSPLQVSELCLGTMMFGDQTAIGRSTAHRGARRDHGVNFIDTADVYTLGASEHMVGELLQGSATTGCWPPRWATRCRTRRTKSRYSRAWVLRECDASLQRLGTDHVDIYYLHRDFNGMDLEEPLRAIDALLRAGKIRYWGVSNFRGWRIAEMVHLARQMACRARWCASPTTTC
jgi:aryl-alcohol dehydrogenase-like predicted oxidoreductase